MSRLADAEVVYTYAFYEALRPKPRFSVWEWADKYRMLSAKDSAEPGVYRSDRTPYLREIQEELSNTSTTKKVVFKKGAQVGATTAGLNWIGYIIDHDPGMTMVVWPTLPDAKKNSKIRLDPLIEATPVLKEKISTGKSRDSKNTGMFKDFENGALIVSGANSASSLRSVPAKNIFGDEVDAWPDNVEGEGSPISLLEARQRTFASRKKTFLVSTPTFKNSSKIHKEYMASDQRHYYVPCPHCNELQILGHEDWERPFSLFDHLHYETEPDADGRPVVLKATLFCKKCGEEIEEHHKPWMFSPENGAKWIKHNPKSDVAGFFLPAIYSPLGWMSWKDICQDYVNAKHENDEDLIMSWVNLSCGEVYEMSGEKPVKDRIFQRRENYAIGTVPRGVVFLCCSVDVQDNRLEAEVIGWGRNREAWSIERKIIIGSPTEEETWDELEEYITQTFQHVDGHEVPIMKVGVDSGFRAQEVYSFCRRFDPRRVIPIKGQDDLPQVFSKPRAVNFRENGKTMRRGIQLWRVGTNIIKTELYGDLGKNAPEDFSQGFPTGFRHFPQYELEYFEQLVAEKRVVTKNKKGYTIVEWRKERERNETLDLWVYNRALAAMVGIDRMSEEQWKKLETNISVVKNLKRPENEKKAPKQSSKPHKQRDEEFWN